jgi:pyruvate dehydrogenase E1 component alpha subunit
LGDLYQNNNAVTICMFGEGATNIGYFHEALNLSKVWNLPVLWVCENNQYGMGTAVARASAVSEIRQKAEGYKILHDCANGMDILDVRSAAEKAIGYVRSGKGPFFIEIETYRFRGHSMGDPERYRKQEEVKKWEESDPIGIFRQAIISKEIAAADDLNELDKQAEVETQEAIQFAENSPEPEPETLFENIFVEE